MSVGLVQNVTGGVGATGAAYTTPNTPGNFLVAAVSWWGGAAGGSAPSDTPTLTDTLGNTWTALAINKTTSPFNTGNSVALRLFYCPNCKAGANTVSINGITADSDYIINLYEFNGVATSSPLDGAQVTTQGTSAGGGTTTPTSGSITTANANELIFATYTNSDDAQGAITAGTNYTLGSSEQQVGGARAHADEYRTNAGAGAQTPAFATVSKDKDWIMTVAAFLKGALVAGRAAPAGVATVTATISAKRGLTTSAAGAATVTVTLTKIAAPLSATAAGVATASAAIQKQKGMTAVAGGAATATATLSVKRSLSVLAAGSAGAWAAAGAQRVGYQRVMLRQRASVIGTSLAFPSNNVAGSLLIAVTSFKGDNSGNDPATASPTISDTQGNAWTALPVNATTTFAFTNTSALRLFYCVNCKAGANTATIANTSPDTDFSLALYEFSGIDTAAPLDGSQVTVQAPGNTTTPTSANITTAGGNDLIFSAYENEDNQQGTMAAGQGWVLVGTDQSGSHADAQAYQIGLQPGTYAPSFRQTGNFSDWLITTVAFKAAAIAAVASGAGTATAVLGARRAASASAGGAATATVALTKVNRTLTATAAGAATASATLNVKRSLSATAGGAATVTATLTKVGASGIQFVQHANSTALGGTAVFGAGVGAGSLIAVFVAITSSNKTVTSVTDDKGNTYVQAPGCYQNVIDGGGGCCDLWYCKNAIGGATTLTLTLSGGSGYMHAYEVTGCDQTDPFDNGVIKWFNGGSTTITGGADVTRNPNTFIAGIGFTPSGGGSNTGFVAQTGWTDDGVANNFVGAAHRTASSISTFTPSWTQALSGETLGLTASFRIATSQTQIKFVQKTGIYPGTSKAYTSNNVAGNFLLAVASWTGGATGSVATTDSPTISDTQGNAWTPLAVNRSTSPLNGNVSVAIRVYYCENCKAGANTVSLANMPADSDYGLQIYEFSGVALSSSIDGAQVTTQSPNATTTTPTSGSITTAGAADLIFLAYANETAAQGTFSAVSGFTLGQNDTSHADAQEYQLNQKVGTYTPSITQGSATKDWILTAVAFKAVAAATTPTATAAGVATASATLIRWKPASVAASGAATVTATIGRLKGITATAAGSSTATASAHRLKGMSVAPAGAGVATASINAKRSVTTSAGGAATVTVTLNVRRALAVTAAGVATTSAALAAKRSLTARAAGAATASAAANARRALTISAAGVATSSATLNAIRRLTASAGGAASVTVNLQRVGFASANAAGKATVTATISARRALAASAAGVASAAATLIRWKPASVLAAGSATAAAAIQRQKADTATAAGLASVSAHLIRWKPASVTAAGAAIVSAALQRQKGLAATAAGSGTVTASIGARRAITVTAAGAASVTASIQKQGQLTVTAAGVATVTVTLTVLHHGSTATAAGAASVAASIIRWKAAAVAPAGFATVSATIGRLRNVAAVAAGASTATVTLGARRSTSATAGGSATVTVALGAIRRVQATAAGQATASAAGNVRRPAQATAGGSSTVTATLSRIRYANAQAAGFATAQVSPSAIRGGSVAAGGAASVSATIGRYANLNHVTASAHGAATATAAIQRVQQAGYQGKYKRQHDAALAQAGEATGFDQQHSDALTAVGNATGFEQQHASALTILSGAGL